MAKLRDARHIVYKFPSWLTVCLMFALEFVPFSFADGGYFTGGPVNGQFSTGSPGGYHVWTGPIPVGPRFQLQGTDTVDTILLGYPADPDHAGSFTYQAGFYGAVTPDAVYLGIPNGTFVSYTPPPLPGGIGYAGAALGYRGDIGMLFHTEYPRIEPLLLSADLLVSGTLAPDDILTISFAVDLQTYDGVGGSHGYGYLPFIYRLTTPGPFSIPFHDSRIINAGNLFSARLSFGADFSITSGGSGETSTVVLDPGAGVSRDLSFVYPWQASPVPEPSSIVIALTFLGTFSFVAVRRAS